MKVDWIFAIVAFSLSVVDEASGFVTPSNRSIKPTGSKYLPSSLMKSRRIVLRPSIETHMVSKSSLNMTPETGRKLVTMGRIPWNKLRLSKSQGKEIISIIRSETHTLDISLMLILAFFSQKIGRFLYQNIFRRFKKDTEYDDSITKKIEENLGQAAKLGLVCYLLDAFEIVLEVAKLKGKQNDFSTLAAKLIYATWVAFRARLYKRRFFEAVFDYASKIGPKSKSVGQVDIVDKISDFFLFGVLSFIWLDILQIKRGNALSSIFALGGAGTLAFTLALQDLAKRVLNGLAITTSDAFNVGDKIVLGDGTTGTVLSVGWLSTVVRADDEIITKIPNSQLSNIRVSNLSTLKISQVKQSLSFAYNYLDVIPDLVIDIKKEIADSCDKVISNATRKLRVNWTGYSPTGLEVVVNCKLSVPPGTGAYHEARQEIMEAIARAVRRNGVEFSPPTEVKLVEGSGQGDILVT